MLETLRKIVQKVSQARELEKVLSIIVDEVKTATEADVCSIYLENEAQDALILMATNGLNSDCEGRIFLPYGVGLVSLVAEKGEPVNLSNAPAHKRFHLFPQLEETAYPAFCGIPIISHRKTLGVLVIQSCQQQEFSEEIVNFLFTISAQLSSAILHARAVNAIPRFQSGNCPFLGIAGSPGIVIAEAVLISSSQKLTTIPDRYTNDTEQELMIFNQALAQVKSEVQELSQALAQQHLPREDVAIFDAYLMLLNSSSFFYSVESHIHAGNWAPGALRKTIEEHIEVFNQMQNSYLQERGKDIMDLGQSILDKMTGNVDEQIQFDYDVILVAEDFNLMSLSKLNFERVKGLVSITGSYNSHITIMARAMAIPMVIGLDDLPLREISGCQLIVDGYSGKVFVSPPVEIKQEYRYLEQQEREFSKSMETLQDKPSVTLDGHPVPLYLNMGLDDTSQDKNNYGAQGVGLFRTEYPFMINSRFPGEKEQFQWYQKIADRFAPDPVVMRTLDIGGDKDLSYFPIEEENPFLGWRGIRVSLDHPEIFIIQLRAILRANKKHNNIHILLPMVSTLDEIDEAKDILLRAFNELYEEAQQPMMPKLGVMIEVPALIFQIEQIAKLVDFISIGTNDLIQYLLAVDRNNPQVASIYESFHPAVIAALHGIISKSHKANIPVSVCGEMASDPLASILLIGMGVDSLSCNIAALNRIKWVIRSFTRSEAQQIVREVMQQDNARAIREILTLELEQKGLGGLVRAGK